MLKEILILGIGGDGVQLTGNFLMNAFVNNNYNVSFYPIYGSQMRGGESTLIIKVSDEEIVNPLLSSPDIVAIVNGTHFGKYENYAKHARIIDISESKILKNKNIVLLARIVKELKFVKTEDIHNEIIKKFKKEELRNRITDCFDNEMNKSDE